MGTRNPIVGETEAINRSGGEAFVAVVQSADLRNRNDLPSTGWLHRSSLGAIFVQ